MRINFDEHHALSALGALSGALVLSLAVAALCLLRNKFRPGLCSIPGPALAAYSALWRWYDVSKGNAQWTAIQLHRKHGPLVRIGPNHISVGDPREIKNIYGLKSGYTKSAFYPIQSVTWKGRTQMSLFNTRDEAYHRQMKKPIANSYSMTTLLTNEAAVDSCSKVLMEKLGHFADENQPVDLGAWIQFYTFDVVGNLTFSENLGFLEKGGDVDGIIAALENILAYCSQVGQIPQWHKFLLGNPLLPYIFPSMENANQVLNFTLKAINSVLNNGDHSNGGLNKGDDDLHAKSLEHRGDMMSKWYALKLADPERITTPELVIHLTGNVFAGSDTTAIAIRSVLYHLLKYPDKMAKVMDELNKAAAEGELSSPVSFKDSTNHLPYLRAAIKEGMRIHPSVGLLLERHVPEGGAVICGKHIPADTIVGINSWVVHHDAEIFPDPESFLPERWLEASPDEFKRMEQSIFTFGAGPRTCIGKHIALMEISKVVPELLKNFEITLADPGREWTTQNNWFVQQKGLVCRLKRRDHNQGACCS